MNKYMTVKQMKEEINGWHEGWDDWVVLFNGEPVYRDEFDIEITTGDDFDNEDEDE